MSPYGSLAAYEDQACAFVRAAKAKSTLLAYRSDWKHFTAWRAGHGQSSLPATSETVGYYLTALAATHWTATLRRRLTGIGKAHQSAGFSELDEQLLSWVAARRRGELQANSIAGGS